MNYYALAKQTYLFSVVRYGLQDGTQCLEADGYIQQMGCVEKVVEVSKQWEQEVESNVEEGLKQYNIKK